MSNKMKYLVHKYLPNSMPYLIIFKEAYQQSRIILKQFLSSWKHINTMKNSAYFDSTDMTYKKVIVSTFQECHYCLKSPHLIYFGEITKGSHRFLITEEKLESIETQLIEILNMGYLIDIEKNNIRIETISDKNISFKKLRKKIKKFTLLRIYKVYKNEFDVIEFGSKTAFEIERWYLDGTADMAMDGGNREIFDRINR